MKSTAGETPQGARPSRPKTADGFFFDRRAADPHVGADTAAAAWLRKHLGSGSDFDPNFSQNLDQLLGRLSDLTPDQRCELAHDTATAFLEATTPRSRKATCHLLPAAAASYMSDLAELWSETEPTSKAGSLWRLYLLKLLVERQPQQISALLRHRHTCGEYEGETDPQHWVNRLLGNIGILAFDHILEQASAFWLLLARLLLESESGDAEISASRAEAWRRTAQELATAAAQRKREPS